MSSSKQKRLVLTDLEEENEDAGGTLTPNILTSRSKVEFDRTFDSVRHVIHDVSKREGSKLRELQIMKLKNDQLLDQAVSRLVEKDRELKNTKDVLGTVESKKEALLNETGRLRSEVFESSTLIEELRARNRILRNQLDDSEKSLREVLGENRSLKTKLSAVQQQLSILAKPGSGDVVQHKLEIELESKNQKIAEMTRRLHESSHEIQLSKVNQETMEKTCSELEESLVGYEMQLKNHKSKSEKATKQLLEERKSIAIQLDDMHKKELENQGTIFALNQSLSMLKETNNDLKNELEKSRVQHQKQIDSLAQTHIEKVNDLRTEMNEQNKQQQAILRAEHDRLVNLTLQKISSVSQEQARNQELEESSFREEIYSNLRSLINVHIPIEQHRRTIEAIEAKTQAEIQSMKAKCIEEVRQKIGEREAELHRDFTKSLSILENEMKELKDMESSHRTETERLAAALESKRSDLQLYQTRLQTEETFRRTVQTNLQDANKQIWSLKTYIEGLEKRNNQNRGTASDLMQSLEKKSELDSQKIETMNIELRSLSTENARLEKELQSTISKRDREIATLKIEGARLKGEKEKLLQTIDGIIMKVEKARKKDEEKKIKLVEDHAAMKIQVSKMKGEIDLLQREKNQLKQVEISALSQTRRLERRVAEMNTNCDNFKKVIETLNSTIVQSQKNHRTELSVARQRQHHLQQQMEQMTAQNMHEATVKRQLEEKVQQMKVDFEYERSKGKERLVTVPASKEGQSSGECKQQ
eukprot:g585.t1